MENTINEKTLIESKVDLMYFRTVRRTTAHATLTDKALTISKYIGIVKDNYSLEEIESYYFFKVALIMPTGIGFKLKNGKKVEFAPLIGKIGKWKSALSESTIPQA
ncbi:hypothetical protein SAMN06265349_10534 [Flavobacterium resistens]|uniref:Uncharacterized protein n=1 Tax=Flavobacterium resistens TaxID=443612 RepID=A0A521EKB6_9FLAO|nr:hypothetical protein [Flavobacterium resistens]MRX67665.1 hypothetical protein [Flavobacterium resistens]SMO84354.1 hypothetical protein SAMN06265349_10534 [Flavobacterium resistens]